MGDKPPGCSCRYLYGVDHTKRIPDPHCTFHKGY